MDLGLSTSPVIIYQFLLEKLVCVKIRHNAYLLFAL